MVGVMPLENKIVCTCSEQTNIQTRSDVLAKMPVFPSSLEWKQCTLQLLLGGETKNCGPAADELKQNKCKQMSRCGNLSQKLAIRQNKCNLVL